MPTKQRTEFLKKKKRRKKNQTIQSPTVISWTLQLNGKLFLSVNKLRCLGQKQREIWIFISSYCNSGIPYSQIYKCLSQCLSTGFSISIYTAIPGA